MSSTEPLSDILHEWIQVFMRRSGQDFKHFMDDSGLSFSQVNTLMRLHHGEQVGISDIGQQIGITNAAASQLVDRLVQMHLLERTEDPVDRRIKRLTLTAKGDALVEKLIDFRRQWMVKFTNSLTPQQREAVSSALKVMTEAVRNIEE